MLQREQNVQRRSKKKKRFIFHKCEHGYLQQYIPRTIQVAMNGMDIGCIARTGFELISSFFFHFEILSVYYLCVSISLHSIVEITEIWQKMARSALTSRHFIL